MTYIATVEYDAVSDEHLLVFPPELLVKLDWKHGDTLEWLIEDDNDGHPVVLIRRIC
jgi:hypothetical protein